MNYNQIIFFHKLLHNLIISFSETKSLLFLVNEIIF